MSKALATGMAILMIATGLVMGGCAASSSVPGVQPLPEGTTYEGLWYSEQFEHMYLQRDGDRVTGVYAYGPGGRLEGTVEGNRLLFDWVEPGDRGELRRERSGKGYFQLIDRDEGPQLVGEWGYGEARSDGGPWTAEFVREAKDDDPTTIEAIREIH